MGGTQRHTNVILLRPTKNLLLLENYVKTKKKVFTCDQRINAIFASLIISKDHILVFNWLSVDKNHICRLNSTIVISYLLCSSRFRNKASIKKIYLFNLKSVKWAAWWVVFSCNHNSSNDTLSTSFVLFFFCPTTFGPIPKKKSLVKGT